MNGTGLKLGDTPAVVPLSLSDVGQGILSACAIPRLVQRRIRKILPTLIADELRLFIQVGRFALVQAFM